MKEVSRGLFQICWKSETYQNK